MQAVADIWFWSVQILHKLCEAMYEYPLRFHNNLVNE